jgi:DNA modification methylase
MTVIVHEGDCRDVLHTLPDQSVHCIVTSPPYFGLRDYALTPSIWGGAAACAHDWDVERITGELRLGLGLEELSTRYRGGGKKAGTIGEISAERACCRACGAWRGTFGLEPTIALYVEHMVEICRELRRVLRDDGTLWINLGDSYATGDHCRSNSTGLKPKDLCGMPWRVAFALQGDGWFLRSDIVWAKPNPMPESVTDRPTRAHEYIFLFAKSQRYFYDAVAIREPMQEVSLKRLSQPNVFEQEGGPKDSKSGNRSHRKAIQNQAERLIKHEKWSTRFEGWDQYDKSLGRNKRTVWEVATLPFAEAHFATFPPTLIEPCILAGCPERCCAKCGAPFLRRLQSEFVPQQDVSEANGVRGAFAQKPMDASNGWQDYPRGSTAHTTLGFAPSCTCDAGVAAGTVLDPFGGAGTTGLVADRLARNAVLIERNSDYAAMARRRISSDAPLFAQVT